MHKRQWEDEDDNGFGIWGGYMNAKKSKLSEQFNEEAIKSGLKVDDLFKGIKIFVNGYTDPSADEIRLLMMKHGGQYHHYLRTTATTHIIASNLPDSKDNLTKQFKVVKPEWITQSIKSNKILDYRDFLLLTARSKSQAALTFANTGNKSNIRPTKKHIKSTTDSEFIDEFFANSRLHHISTMGATFKEYINQLRSNVDHICEDKTHLVNKYPPSGDTFRYGNRVIMHIDMDCFFVSVGLRDKPHLLGKPVAVTHSKGGTGPTAGANLLQEIELYRKKLGYKPGESYRICDSGGPSVSMAEISSCSYEARAKGIKNGMFVGQALKLCPQLQFIHYDFEAYKNVSYLLYDSVARYTLDIEAVSCDEMYVDLSSLLQETSASPMEFASILRKQILEKTGCASSVGLGSNKLIARLATKKAKPNGQFWIQDDQIEGILNRLPLTELPGVGRSSANKLGTLGIKTCGDVQMWSLQEIQRELGKKLGETLYDACRGKELKGLVFTHVRKSVSADVNYGIRLQNDVERDKFLNNLSCEVSKRLGSIQMKGRCLTLKLMIKSEDAPEESAKYMGHGVCDHMTKCTSLLTAIYSTEDIYREIKKIINKLNLNSKNLRGIGIQMSRLEPFVAARNKLKDFIINVAGKKQAKIISETKVDVGPVATTSNAGAIKPVKEVPVVIQPLKQKYDYNLQHKEKSQDVKVVHKYLTPAELRAMIKTWVETEERPKEKDKRIILSYLLQLGAVQQLEEMFLILKTFFVYVKRYKNVSRWTRAYQHIMESMQAFMVENYGGRLKLNGYSFS